jgi:hypothetical protein
MSLTEIPTIPDRPGKFLLSLIRARRPRQPRPSADLSPTEIVALAEAEAGLDAGEGTLLDRIRRVLATDAPMPPVLYGSHNVPAVADLIAAAQGTDPAGSDDLIEDGARFLDPDAYESLRAEKLEIAS